MHHFRLHNQGQCNWLHMHIRIQSSSNSFHDFHRKGSIDKGRFQFDLVSTRQKANVGNVVSNALNKVLFCCRSGRRIANIAEILFICWARRTTRKSVRHTPYVLPGTNTIEHTNMSVTTYIVVVHFADAHDPIDEHLHI